MNKILLFISMAVIALCAAGCEKKTFEQSNTSLIGHWVFVDRADVTLEIDSNEIRFVPVSESPRSYRWIAADSIEMTQLGFMGEYVTQNRVISHRPDSVSIKDWFVGNDYVDWPIYADVTLIRIR